jgi:hypothetical protein
LTLPFRAPRTTLSSMALRRSFTFATMVTLAAALTALSVADCGGSAQVDEVDASTGHDAGSCHSNDDCPHGTVCGFNPDDGCNAIGSCVVGEDNTHAQLMSCGCDGGDLYSAYGLDLNATPARHSGSCADGVCLFGVDAQSICQPSEVCTTGGCSNELDDASTCGVMACDCVCADPTDPSCDCR